MSGGPEVLRLEFTWTADDLRKATAAALDARYQLSSGRLKVEGILGCAGITAVAVIVSVVLFLPPINQSVLSKVLWDLLAGIVGTAFIYTLFARPIVAALRRPKPVAPGTGHSCVFEVLEGGIRFSEPAERSDYRWEAIKGVREAPDLFLIYLDARSFRFIPKRVFAGTDASEKFRRTLEERISPLRRGFPVITATKRSPQ